MTYKWISLTSCGFRTMHHYPVSKLSKLLEFLGLEMLAEILICKEKTSRKAIRIHHFCRGTIPPVTMARCSCSVSSDGSKRAVRALFWSSTHVSSYSSEVCLRSPFPKAKSKLSKA